MKKLRVLSLFAGIGGFDLGLERTGGFETVAFCEIDPFCRRVLAKHWPGVPCYHDVRELTVARLRDDGITIDCVVGGFPCQPFSSASRGRRVAIDLWPEMRRIIGTVRPKFVIAENVAERPINNAQRQLFELAYFTFVRRISAGEIGADHSRSRWWLCAHTDDQSQFHRGVDAEVASLSAVRHGVWKRPHQPERLRVLDGVPDRVDRLRALGNAVVPQIPELIGNAILTALGHKTLARSIRPLDTSASKLAGVPSGACPSYDAMAHCPECGLWLEPWQGCLHLKPVDETRGRQPDADDLAAPVCLSPFHDLRNNPEAQR